MAIPTYRQIPDANLEPEEPIRSVDALALRDNPLAIAQADELDDPVYVHAAGLASDVPFLLFRWGTSGIFFRENAVYDGIVDQTYYEESGAICRRAPMSAGGTGTLTLLNNYILDIIAGMVLAKVKMRVELTAVAGDPDASYITVTIAGSAAVNSAVIPNPTPETLIEVDVPLAATGNRTLQLTVTNPNAANRVVLTLHEVWVYGYYNV